MVARSSISRVSCWPRLVTVVVIVVEYRLDFLLLTVVSLLPISPTQTPPFALIPAPSVRTKDQESRHDLQLLRSQTTLGTSS